MAENESRTKVLISLGKTAMRSVDGRYVTDIVLPFKPKLFKITLLYSTTVAYRKTGGPVDLSLTFYSMLTSKPMLILRGVMTSFFKN